MRPVFYDATKNVLNVKANNLIFENILTKYTVWIFSESPAHKRSAICQKKQIFAQFLYSVPKCPLKNRILQFGYLLMCLKQKCIWFRTMYPLVVVLKSKRPSQKKKVYGIWISNSVSYEINSYFINILHVFTHRMRLKILMRT